MNELFSIDELTVLRHALNIITIQGKDAKPIASLQDKLDGLLAQQQIERQEKLPTKK